MTLRMLWPLWVIIIVFGALLALTIWRAVATDGSRRIGWLRRVGMVACVTVIALCPAVADRTADGLISNAEVYVVVDRTGSMAAEDYDGQQARLEGVAQDIATLTEEIPSARYSIISFDSQASRQLPLTTDARAVRTWAETVTQEVTQYSSGSLVDRPLGVLTDALTTASENNPANVRLVFFASDGENTADGDAASLADLAPLVDGGAVLGYGTPDGGPMREYYGDSGSGFGTDAPYIQDPNTGTDALSMIDESSLRTIAEQLGVEYLHRTEPSGLEAVTAGIDLEQIAEDGRRDEVVTRDVYWPAAVVLVLLMAWESWDLSRRVPRVRRPGTRRPRGADSATQPARETEPVPAGRGTS